jgi:acyl-CoA thioester hydrolase
MRRVTVSIAQPTDRKPPYRFSAFTRVAFSDTDAQGVVYYGRYNPFFDLARVEYHRFLGMLDRDRPFGAFVMRASHVVYEAPAGFDDLLEIFVRVSRIGRTSATYDLAAYRADDDRLTCSADQTLVLVDREERRPVPIPDVYRTAVTTFEGAGFEVGVPQ